MAAPTHPRSTNKDHATGAAVIGTSHQRSASFGLRESDPLEFASPMAADLRYALEKNQFLFRHAAPVMETLHEQIANTHSMVLLTCAQGMVLHTLGDADFLEKASRVALTPGMEWSEQLRGTNAIGTALSEQEAITIHGDQHYLNANKILTCSCAPIFDPYGQIVGALDVTGDHRSFHHHTLALVRMSAQMIENHMFAGVFPQAVRIHFHTRPEFLGTLVEGIAVFTPEGRFISANRSGQFQLSMSHAALQAHTLSSLFGVSMSELSDLFGTATPAVKSLVLHNGVTVWARATLETPPRWGHPPGTPGLTHAAAATQITPVDTTRGAATSLEELDTGDEQVASAIRKLRLVNGKNIPIMILGETGTGKELLAQAIHDSSPRAGRPFVAVNCASIPESLIESELFGYEEGAFTGARKKGAIGKILQAHGGTLFLDEIGDMPRQLQARLLRVLQERKVSPLGAGKELDVDIAVICATHKSLKDMIGQGQFRQDLYYRLNGLVIRLPALRERSDFDTVTRNILKTLGHSGQGIDISAPVLQLFKDYPWPGNLRQLHNLLRTAAILVDDDGCIGMEHLPEDFLEELTHPGATTAQGQAGGLRVPAPARHYAAFGSTRPSDPFNLQDLTISTMAQTLRAHNGNVSAAARALGVSRNTIYRKKNLLPTDALRSH